MAPFVVKGSLTCQFVVVACRAVGCCGRGKRKRGQVNVRHCHCCQAGQRPTSAWAPAVPLGCRDCARAGRGERSARLFHRAATRNSYDNMVVRAGYSQRQLIQEDRENTIFRQR
eukprot:scaffold181444_cov31-Tisochrysis_lutea.AAC.1